MFVLRFGRSDRKAKRANKDLQHDETKALLERIADAVEGIDESLARIAEDSYKTRMER